MIDGSFDNSILTLITGYNGLGRIFGASGPGGGGGGNFSGTTGVLRLFNSVMSGQASWLLPAALLALVVGLVATRRAPRTDRTRAALLLWGGWLIVSGLVFSLSSGIIHSYYTVALAPAIAALAAIGGRMLWARRASARSRLAAAAAVAVSAGWAWDLLDRTPSWEPGSQSAASLELATGGAPVMAIGGFDNEGRNLTLTQFEHYVKGGEIHYYIASEGGGPGGGGPGGGGNSSGAITTWVKAHYKAVTVGGQTLYELTSPVS
jgi:4-amino-4-deoxy-L-arabinose transferase-like glycosyltransferase